MYNISHSELLSYQPDCGEKFQQERDKVQDIFDDKAVNIEHIGSTAIPGLNAKPIIDIAVLIEKQEDADNFIESLNRIGYRYDKENSSSERHLFRKGDPTVYHLSIAYADKGGFWNRQILFRDYLRNHPEARDEYSKLKSDLMNQDPTGGNEYIAGKSEFIQKILKLAQEEFPK